MTTFEDCKIPGTHAFLLRKIGRGWGVKGIYHSPDYIMGLIEQPIDFTCQFKEVKKLCGYLTTLTNIDIYTFIFECNVVAPSEIYFMLWVSTPQELKAKVLSLMKKTTAGRITTLSGHVYPEIHFPNEITPSLLKEFQEV